MKKKQKDIAIKRIQKLLESLDWMFQINNLQRDMVLKEKDEENKAAEVVYDESYQNITINIYPCFFEHDLKNQRKMILHELCHTITLPSKLALHDFLDGKLVTPDAIYRINEKATSKIENLLDSLLRGKLQYASKAYKEYLK